MFKASQQSFLNLGHGDLHLNMTLYLRKLFKPDFQRSYSSAEGECQYIYFRVVGWKLNLKLDHTCRRSGRDRDPVDNSLHTRKLDPSASKCQDSGIGTDIHKATGIPASASSAVRETGWLGISFKYRKGLRSIALYCGYTTEFDQIKVLSHTSVHHLFRSQYVK